MIMVNIFSQCIITNNTKPNEIHIVLLHTADKDNNWNFVYIKDF